MGFNLDIAKMKFLKSDENSTTLQHPKGHTVTIAHNVLSPKNREALQALSKVATDARTPDQASEYGKVVKKFAQGGKPALTPNTSPQPMYFDDGGKVPVPDQPDAGQQDKQARAQGIAKGSQQGTAIPSASEIVNRLKNAWAEGGKIEQMRSQHGGEGNETCHACGGPIHRAKYESGTTDHPVSKLDTEDVGPEVTDNENYAHKLMSGKVSTPQEEPKLDIPKEKADAQKMYNMLIAGNAANAQPGTAEYEANKNLMFGPNGEPPKSIDTNNYTAAKNLVQQQYAQAAGYSANKAAQIQAENAIRQEMGALPLPVPGQLQQEVTNADASQGTVPQAGSGDVSQVQGQPQEAKPTGDINSDYEQMYTKGLQGQIGGIRGAAAAQAGQFGEAQKQYAQQQNTLRELEINHQREYDDLMAERNNIMQDINNGHIDPDKYWTGDAEGHGGHSKIMTGIGMILAGFNPTNRPNAAIDFLKFQMDKNLDAQAKNLNSKQNLLRANLEQFHNMEQAKAFSRLNQTDMLAAKINEAASKYGGPMAQANAQRAIGQLQMEAAPVMLQLSMQRAMMNVTKNGSDPNATEQTLNYMDMLNPEMAKSYRARYVPGYGFATAPVPDALKTSISSYKSVNDLMNQSLAFSQAHRGAFDKLSPAEISKAKTIQMQLIASIKQAQHDGVYKPSEAEFLTSQIGGSPISFLSKISSEPKIRTMQQNIQNEYNNALAPYGLHGKQLPQVAPEASDEGETGTLKDSTIRVKKINGKWTKI